MNTILPSSLHSFIHSHGPCQTIARFRPSQSSGLQMGPDDCGCPMVRSGDQRPLGFGFRISQKALPTTTRNIHFSATVHTCNTSRPFERGTENNANHFLIPAHSIATMAAIDETLNAFKAKPIPSGTSSDTWYCIAVRLRISHSTTISLTELTSPAL